MQRRHPFRISSDFEALFDHAAMGIIVTNRKGIITAINDLGLRMFGYSTEEIMYKPINLLIPERYHTSHTRHHEIYFQHPGSRPMGKGMDLYATRKNGEEFPVEISLASFQKDNEPFTVAYIVDISERKQQEEAVRMEEKRIRLLIEHTPAAIAMFDREMRFIIVSKRWLDDYKPGDGNIIGKRLYDVFPDIANRWKDLHQRCLKGEEFSANEEAFTRKNGSIDWIKWELCPWYANDQQIGGVILFTEVITDKKLTQQAFQQLNENLDEKITEKTRELSEALSHEKELSELKTRFVSMASHEFRTPLSTILSSAYLLEKYASIDDQPKRQRHIQRIISSVNIMTDILNEFLSVGRIEEGKINVKKEAMHITELIRAIIDEIRVNLKTGQYISYIHKGATDLFSIDKSLFTHIIMNLISNASKFSAENMAIEVLSEINPQGLTIEVKDYGIGISKIDQEHLAERFFRGANATNIQGTGLGLHIVSRYVELMQGRLAWNSELEKGTSFTISLSN